MGDLSTLLKIHKVSDSADQICEQLLEQLKSALFVVNNRGEILSCYGEIDRFFGIQASELVQKRLVDVLDPVSTDVSFENCLDIFCCDFPLQCKNKANEFSVSRTFSFWMSSLNCESDTEELYLVTLQDLSKQREIEDQLAKTIKLSALGQLAGGVAHDINNLLSGISGSAQAMKRTLKDDESSQRKLNIITQCVQRASGLLRQIVDYVREDNGEPKQINVGELLYESIALLERTIRKEIVIECSLGEQLSAIYGDASQLLSVLMNLGINARDAINSEGKIVFNAENIDVTDLDILHSITGKIEPGSYVCITVEDSGCGVSPDEQKKIFNPLYTTKARGKGTGLGLSMVRDILIAHKGFITLQSAPGKTKFSLYLPKHDNDLRDETIETQSVVDYDVLKGLKILLVDDEELVREATQDFLENFGINVTSVDDGDVALTTFKNAKENFDVIVLDANMPRQNGMKTFFLLRDVNPTVPVIFCSGIADAAAENMQISAQSVQFVKKPYEPDELLGKLASFSSK
ncbi:MAG: response regulator [Deltaproteobacteria bacterium]|nr:response regulator [Deltaproteobacteria bacterium]